MMTLTYKESKGKDFGVLADSLSQLSFRTAPHEVPNERIERVFFGQLQGTVYVA